MMYPDNRVLDLTGLRDDPRHPGHWVARQAELDRARRANRVVGRVLIAAVLAWVVLGLALAGWW